MIECVDTRREQTISENIGLVHSCAHRFKGRGIEYDDLFQAGCMGLCKAVDAFDPQHGVKLSTYAVPVILGEMRRLFRDGGAVKVSRTLKELSLRIGRARELLALALGREPSVSELAQAMELPEEQVVEALCAAAPPLSLTESDEDGGGQIDLPADSPEDQLADVISLNQVVEKLEDKDRALIELRYYSGMTQVQTAARLGMTQVQVSRREKKILGILRQQLL